MTTVTKAASQITVGDKIVRTLNHDGSPKRTAIVRAVTIWPADARGATRYMFYVGPDNDSLGWYSATYQFTIEV